jgi:hypothetical protein
LLDAYQGALDDLNKPDVLEPNDAFTLRICGDVKRIDMAVMVVFALVRATSNTKPSQFISVGPHWQQECDSNFSQEFQ